MNNIDFKEFYTDTSADLNKAIEIITQLEMGVELD